MKKILILLFATVLVSCKEKHLDLAQIDFNRPANEYTSKFSASNVNVQKGHWEVTKNGMDFSVHLKDDGEVSTNYIFSDPKDRGQLQFDVYHLAPNSGARIVEYKEKIVFYNFGLAADKTFDVLKTLKTKLGVPTEVIPDTLAAKDPNLAVLSKSIDKNDMQTVKGKSGEDRVTYPAHYVWKKAHIIYQYTLLPADNTVGNDLMAIDINAFKARIISGYQDPKDTPVLGKYAE